MIMITARFGSLIVDARTLARVFTVQRAGGIRPSRSQVEQGPCQDQREKTPRSHVGMIRSARTRNLLAFAMPDNRALKEPRRQVASSSLGREALSTRIGRRPV